MFQLERTTCNGTIHVPVMQRHEAVGSTRSARDHREPWLGRTLWHLRHHTRYSPTHTLVFQRPKRGKRGFCDLYAIDLLSSASSRRKMRVASTQYLFHDRASRRNASNIKSSLSCYAAAYWKRCYWHGGVVRIQKPE